MRDVSATFPDMEGNSPEAMRQAMADYVRALHQAYLDATATLPPAERARLPLVSADDITVVAAGVRMLHIIGTTESLPAPRPPEVEVRDAIDDLQWSLRFFDPVVAPGLGLIDESEAPAYDDVRRALGVRTVVYHLAVPPGGTLTAHHAQHAGTGLGHSHAAAARDFDALRAYAVGQEALVDELQGAHLAGLIRAQVLIARELAPRPADFALDPPMDGPELRRALVEQLRRHS
jgi:hypothetical protein